MMMTCVTPLTLSDPHSVSALSHRHLNTEAGMGDTLGSGHDPARSPLLWPAPARCRDIIASRDNFWSGPGTRGRDRRDRPGPVEIRERAGDHQETRIWTVLLEIL